MENELGIGPLLEVPAQGEVDRPAEGPPMLDGQNILPAQLVVGQLGGVLARYGRNLQYRELVAVGGDDRPAVPRSQDPLVAALAGPLRIQDDMLDEGVRLSPNRHQIVLPGAPELLHPQRRFFPDDSLPRACERGFSRTSVVPHLPDLLAGVPRWGAGDLDHPALYRRLSRSGVTARLDLPGPVRTDHRTSFVPVRLVNSAPDPVERPQDVVVQEELADSRSEHQVARTLGGSIP